MSLSPGTKLGTFEVVDLLGVGGMGEVYRARDTKLGREVAIKVLPAQVASDPERIARFDREAKLLASLTHPHIAALYEFRKAKVPAKPIQSPKAAARQEVLPDGISGPPLQSDGEVHFLVMELVEGETLADRLERGTLPVDEAIPLFIQIAEALEAAHDKDIVHRDLKPGNIKITEDDKVKVLDFGIAKSLAPPETTSTVTPMPSSPDATTLAGTPMPPASITGTEMIIGTPTYMSPEQARGKKIDKRSDVWSFGCCLYQAITGAEPFAGDTIADTISSITRDEPDWTALPADVPSDVRRLLRRCLEKEPRRRLSSMSDMAIALEDAGTDLRAARTTSRVKARGTGISSANAEEDGIRSLVVLPFDNLMGDPEQEYFVDGMTDALSAELSKIKALKVISRGSAMRFKGTVKSMTQIAQELGVDGLVEG